jgi:predicted nuclease of predicted toxin-antitoxin system
MVRFLADENFDGRVVRGLLRRRPGLDLVRVQDVGLSGADDPTLLAFAATEDRLVLTHDVQTLAGFAHARTAAGEPMPGVVEVPDYVPTRQAIDDLELLAVASRPGEWAGQVLFVPF